MGRLGYRIVPMIHRWPLEPAVLPCRRLVAGLLASAALVRVPDNPAGVVFLLDAERAGPEGYHPPIVSKRFDNRYQYGPHLFPQPGFLRAQEIGFVLWVSAGDVPAADVRPYLALLEETGIRVEQRRWNADAG